MLSAVDWLTGVEARVGARGLAGASGDRERAGERLVP